MSIFSEPVAKKLKKRLPKEKSEKQKRREKARGEPKSFYDDPYEEEYPWTVPPMSAAEILKAIRDGPSMNQILNAKANSKNSLDTSSNLDSIGSKIDQPELDKLSPKTHNEQFYEPIGFETFEDFMNSSYYERFAAKAKREVPLTKEELGSDMVSLL